jgi:hypothetical protein
MPMGQKVTPGSSGPVGEGSLAGRLVG